MFREEDMQMEDCKEIEQEPENFEENNQDVPYEDLLKNEKIDFQPDSEYNKEDYKEDNKEDIKKDYKEYNKETIKEDTKDDKEEDIKEDNKEDNQPDIEDQVDSPEKAEVLEDTKMTEYFEPGDERVFYDMVIDEKASDELKIELENKSIEVEMTSNETDEKIDKNNEYSDSNFWKIDKVLDL